MNVYWMCATGVELLAMDIRIALCGRVMVKMNKS